MLKKGSGKIIRDSVHGDIYIEKEFLDLVETPEFQRLRRIHQLSVANLVFPSAEHTRFSHSIGTFYIMKNIISHFEKEFNSLNIQISDEEKKLVLVIALLHDIGHGPFSHAFEGIANEEHEEWTKKIILNEDSNINKVLIKNFDINFPSKLVELLDKKKVIKDRGIDRAEKENVNLFFVISSLISSQLDADRIDYLLRDSFNTGVKFGNIDLSRIINAMSLTEYNNEIYVCIEEKYLSDIEEYLLARYQMHENVYFHDTKCEVELVIEKIFKRIEETVNKDNLDYVIPRELMPIFNKKELSLRDYIELDDYVLIGMFKKFRYCDDIILNYLSRVILERSKFTRLEIMDNSDIYVEKFKCDMINIINQFNYETENLSNEYFWLEKEVKNSIYKKNKENIWILKNNGVVSDISQLSSITNLCSKKKMIFINKNMLLSLSGNNKDILDKVNMLIETYSNRKHIEIERKYIIENSETKKDVIDLIGKSDIYVINRDKEIKQVDIYYDTENFELLNKKISLRIREIDSSEYYLTIKLPTIEGNSERFEYEFTILNNNLSQNIGILSGYIDNDVYQLVNNVVPVLRIINNRDKYCVNENNIFFELVFDNVVYENLMNKRSMSEMQLEIELKGNYLNRINLKKLSDYIKCDILHLYECKESKYKRGITLTTKGD
jgi:HD superfamily phosphohydrolase/CYTH domain-containing protein